MKREEAIEFYKGERTRFEKSRDIQWKFDLAVWTLIALAINFFDKGKIGDFRFLAGFLTFAFLATHLIFCYLMQRGLVAARDRSDNIMNKLNESSLDEVDLKADRKPVTLISVDWFWIVFQVGATAILLSVFYIRISC